MREELTNNEFSLLMDLMLFMVKNNHIDELREILEKYQKSDLLNQMIQK